MHQQKQVALHDIAPGDTPYLWEALKELKQPQSVERKKVSGDK